MIAETLDVTARQLSLMEAYLQRFLTIGRPEQRRAKPSVRRPMDLADAVSDVLPLVRPACEHAHIELQFAEPTESFMIAGDEQAIGQLLFNLLLIAVEAATAIDDPGSTASSNVAGDSGFSKTGNREGIVRVEILRPTDGRLACRVSDTGCGPDPAIRDRLGEPFVTDKPDGTGLGLAVVRQIAEEHDAKLSWQRVGELTQFTVTFPAAAETFVPN